ncbi:hypothetical protein [Halalkalibacter urbisdiaboli]|uniref:hypothetical protein n=1 Tax=Halalkalibacter urbisdiaboli TaxID=1960589 RepID=UPI000B44DB1A|nr:hypothetical protein [Halalkalibacter urbisdiaboli]
MNKKQVEHLLSQINTMESSLTKEVAEKIRNVKEMIGDSDFTSVSHSHVVTHPATESVQTENIETTLLALYEDVEKLARETKDEPISNLVTTLQHVLEIEEKDGYFP